ncbi:MAG: peptidase M22 [Anaerotruncus sp.]|nr:peptidase M22 [Anaerotruncus sp.]
MAYYLGLDTSNYTTSVALYDGDTDCVIQQKRLLPVKEGALGLRQSDAVFAHVKQLGELVSALMADKPVSLAGIGVSVRPRETKGSYMPCFLVGQLVAESLAAVGRLPLTHVSHQDGHIAAALYATGQLGLIGKPFAAFHFSGGTTECLLVRPGNGRCFSIELVAQSLDLKAGQAVDRVGGLLGLSFPAGKALDSLARESQAHFCVKPSLKGADCSLSGIENRCQRMLAEDAPPCDVARYCIESILAVVDRMTAWVRESYGELPIVYSGGVMSNSLIQEHITQKYGGYFASPQFSSDNAAGVAVLAKLAQTGGAAE